MSFRSPYWQYFQKLNQNEAECRICQKKIKTSLNMRNIAQHLQKCHVKIYHLIQRNLHRRETDSSNNDSKPNLDSNADSIVHSSSCSTSAESAGSSSIITPLLDTPTTSTSNSIAKDNVPFTFAEKESFRRLLKVMAPHYVVPSLRGIVSTQLSEVKSFAATCDIWTETQSMTSYLDIINHYIMEDEIKSLILDKIMAIVMDVVANMMVACTSYVGEAKHMKTKKIIQFFHQSVIAADALKKKTHLKMIQSVPTRWNSAFAMHL
ncbi:hypothetical protein PGB90_005308 [Kerria lacca]